MILVVTDGSPANGHATRDVIELCKNSNVEVIGIGVGSSEIAHYVDNHIVINSVGDLHKTLFTLMTKTLIAA